MLYKLGLMLLQKVNWRSYFVHKHDIKSGKEILLDYGKNYNGVEPCVESCMKCKHAVTKLWMVKIRSLL